MSANVSFTIAGTDAEKLKEKIREESLKKGLSMSEWITDAVVDYLRRQSNGGQKP